MEGSGKKRAVVLLSGGLDSLVAAALTREGSLTPCPLSLQERGAEAELVLAITCDYGQRAARREVEAAGRQCAWLGCAHEVVALPWLGELGGNALTDAGRELPEPGAEELDTAEITTATARAVWVPNRNGVMVNVAAAYAERLGAEWVVCGFNVKEAATFPDNSRGFMEAADCLWGFSTATGVRMYSPTADWDKREIVARGREVGAPLELVWSCYLGGVEQCGRCESCRRLARALAA
jgi:7-cyano-7-deazaguanine synthase